MKNVSEQFRKKAGNVPEILAPAGTPEALQAAVNAGCDAVYLGGDLFSARAFAGNFDTEAMLKAIDDCHLFGVKLYMTVNTLLKDEELKRLKSYMQPFYEAGLDGVIVQDLGVAHRLRQDFPDLPLHASTQMSVTSASGANLLKRQGFTRIVPARELSLQEILHMKEQSGMEIETFVHGAMCYAYSGKCLFSSFLGGRSGNRGRCAQPCRKCYTLFGGDGKRIRCETENRNDLRKEGRGNLREENHSERRGQECSDRNVQEYLMSLKDLCTLEILPRLIDAGIDSFKIEGRMKNPSYVAATVDAYRKARDFYLELLRENAAEGADNWAHLDDHRQQRYLDLAARLTGDIQDIYNRGGFYTGYYDTEKGLAMTAVDRPNHAGRRIGEVAQVHGPEVRIHLQEELHAQDVLEIRETGTELTSNRDGRAGDTIALKGKDLKRLKAGMAVYRTRNNALLQQIDREILQKERTVPARAQIRAKIGEPLEITLSEPENIVAKGCFDARDWEMYEPGSAKPIAIKVQGELVQKAGSRPVEPEQLIEKMQKTGGTHVEVQATCLADEDLFVPMSEFNALRREAVEQWKAAVRAQYHRSMPDGNANGTGH